VADGAGARTRLMAAGTIGHSPTVASRAMLALGSATAAAGSYNNTLQGRQRMTILVAYVARPEGQAALDKGIEIATRRNERLVVVNAGPGGRDESIVDGYEGERVAERLSQLPIEAEFKHFVRGKSTIEEIEELVDQLQVSVLVIGLRKRSP